MQPRTGSNEDHGSYSVQCACNPEQCSETLVVAVTSIIQFLCSFILLVCSCCFSVPSVAVMNTVTESNLEGTKGILSDCTLES